MRLQREQNELKDGKDTEVRQAKRCRTHAYNDDDANNRHDGHANDNDDGVSVVMDGAKRLMAGKESIDRDNKQHNAFNDNCKEEKLWFLDKSSSESDSAEQTGSSSDDGKLMIVEQDDYQYKVLSGEMLCNSNVTVVCYVNFSDSQEMLQC